MSPAWLLGILLVGSLVLLAVTGTLGVRRRYGVDNLKANNEAAGFIYAVVGVLYAVLLGFTAIIVWERFDTAQGGVDEEANALGDLYRDAQAFPEEMKKEVETNLRDYAHVVAETEWAAMARRTPSPEAWVVFNRLWRTYHEFQPQTDYERIWYAQSLTKLNELGDQRRLRLLNSRSDGIPDVMWIALIGGGIVTIGFSFLFGTKNAWAHVLMTGSLAIIIALVLFSIMALEQPFAGITRVGPESFHLVTRILDEWSRSGVTPPH